MKLGLENKHVLVTGAGRGIGREIAREFVKEGAKVAVVARTKEDIDQLLSELGGVDAGHFGAAIDLEEVGAPAHLVRILEDEFGNIDVLVNNVGSTLNVKDPYCSIEDWRRVFRVNIEIGVELNNLLIPKMIDRGWGRICNILAGASIENHGPVPYCASKAAFMAYTKSMGRILASTNVVMTGVLPGAVFTEGGHWATELEKRPDHYYEYLKLRTAANRFGNCNEISPLVVFMCSQHASFMQGSQVLVDGGQTRAYSF